MISKENKELLAGINGSLETIAEFYKQQNNIKNPSEKEKKRAACALNMCLVSISQIIDYNDQIILDQEYDSILNNINIEAMPKDEALLDILRQLLDTITYFKISDGEKAFIERDYLFKMKNAIWSAVPNIGIIFSGQLNLAGAALSLASQVGIGYMNYRRAKAENSLEYDKQMWELQKTAMEQFNALRRELFTTAWRLADKYRYDEKWRYNEILMDTNPYRRYERLEYIKDNFEAYPSFWYYIAHAALEAENKGKAKEYYNQYFTIMEDCKLLRHDAIMSACALEYIELLDKNLDKDIINQKIQIAEKVAGNHFDVWQLCAIAYLQNENKEKAERLLLSLICEGYNREQNKALLSMLYITNQEKEKYNSLIKISGDSNNIFEWENKISFDDLLKINKNELRLCFGRAIKGFIKYYEDRFNELIGVRCDRCEIIYNMFDEMTDALSVLPKEIFNVFVNCYINKIQGEKDFFEHLNKDSITENDTGFKTIAEDPFKNLCDKMKEYITGIDSMDKIGEIRELIQNHLSKDGNYDEYNGGVAAAEAELSISGQYSHHIGVILQQSYNRNKEYVEIVKKYKDDVIEKDNKNFDFIRTGESNFNKYFTGVEEIGLGLMYKKKRAMFIAVLSDRKNTIFKNIDFIFTTAGIIICPRDNSILGKITTWAPYIGAWRIGENIAKNIYRIFFEEYPVYPYDCITFTGDTMKIQNKVYKLGEGINMATIEKMVDEFKDLANQNWINKVVSGLYKE